MDSASSVPVIDQSQGGYGTGEGEEQGRPPLPHPYCSFFHIFFRAATIVWYVLSTWFTSNFVLVMVVCVLLCAADFWTVKNVSGRLLVGLRWWSEVDDNGDNKWYFECAEDTSRIDDRERRLFWGALYITPAIWVLLAIGCVFQFSFKWLMVVMMALIMTSTNLVGYHRCQKDANKKLKAAAQNFVFDQAAAFMRSQASGPTST